jgi:predicted metal-dependent hydrolase
VTTTRASSFEYGGHVLPFRARFSARSTLSITVLPNGSIEVVAPDGTPEHEIRRRLRKRGHWIVRQRRYFDQFCPRTPDRRYIGGETHLYLGRQYRLKCVDADHEEVKLLGGYLCVMIGKRAAQQRVRALVEGWYQHRAHVKLRERFDAVLPKFERLVRSTPELWVRSMKLRWGSHTPAGRIFLNRDLIRAPTSCIDYVVAHELTHVVHPSHSIAFFRLLGSVFPDWQQRKERLERLLA